MKRRGFLGSVGLLLGGQTADEAAAIKQAIQNCYTVFFQQRDKKKYRSLLTDDYLLLENGEVLDIEGDMRMMPAPGDGYQRSDAFDFRSIQVYGDTACAVYFLESKITKTKEGTRSYAWLESAVMRRSNTGWRMALLHSTKIAKPEA